MKLSICVVTMNRAELLREALQSCLACQLPDETEFVIVDNASTDHTEETVHGTLRNSGFSYTYAKEETNIGAGAGRNKYYELARGEYVFGMDDDVVIDIARNPDFFTRAVEILDRERNAAVLTTQIFDEALGRNRKGVPGKIIREQPYPLYKCRMFCGGSHFLRKSFYPTAPYLSNEYGYEELPPSLVAYDRNALCAFCPDLFVIHRPPVDRWSGQNEEHERILLHDCAVPYAIKRMMYPRVFYPLIWLAYRTRCKKHLKWIRGWRKKVSGIVKNTMEKTPIRYRVRFGTVLRLYRDFGSSVF